MLKHGNKLRRFSGVAGALVLAACTGGAHGGGSGGSAPATGMEAAPAGAVASTHRLATAAGTATLARGGNAADAAVATALALAVAYPQAGNLGGGGFAVARFGGAVTSLDFRETAPAAATADMYLDAEGKPVAARSRVGGLAVGTPGSPAGYRALHRRYGRLPWAEVVAPAIRLARDGMPVGERTHGSLAWKADTLLRFPGTAEFWLPAGAPLPATGRLEQPALARTLMAYAADGPAAVTTGIRAAAVAAAVKANGGILTVTDMAGYRPVWRAPVRTAAWGWQVASMDLPSSGGLLIAGSLGLLQRTGWADAAPGSVTRAHLWTEAWRRAYADRYRLGDPRTTGAGAGELLDPAWLDRRAAEIDPLRATPSTAVAPWPGDEVPAATTQTTHLSVIDADGNVVSMTVTLNGSFGSGIYVPGVGIFLNNEMDDFAADPGRANMFGLVQGPANAVGPGKRMLSSMAPTVAWRADEAIAIGSPGGSRIPTATMQVLARRIVDGAPLGLAVAAPRIHHQWLPDELVHEDGALSPALRGALAARGHRLATTAWPVGEVHAAERRAGVLNAAADPRGPGAAALAFAP